MNSFNTFQNDHRFETTTEVKPQLKFLEEVDALERKRHEEVERGVLLRAAKVCFILKIFPPPNCHFHSACGPNRLTLSWQKLMCRFKFSTDFTGISHVAQPDMFHRMTEKMRSSGPCIGALGLHLRIIETGLVGPTYLNHWFHPYCIQLGHLGSRFGFYVYQCKLVLKCASHNTMNLLVQSIYLSNIK